MQENKLDGQAEIAATKDTHNGEEIWKSHVMAAQEFSGTIEEYCRLNGLSLKAFKDHKRKHGLTRRYRRNQTVAAHSQKEPKAFVKVECKPEPTKAPLPTNPSPQHLRVRASASGVLPDPKWMAEFVTELLALR